MIVTVFRSRLNPDAQNEYKQWASRMSTLAAGIPGYISHKGFVAEDGERVTIVEFESEEGMHAWATHPDHVAAKKKGRSVFFTDFRVQVCNVVRDTADHWSCATASRPIL
ncbi:antibiotic biosynthesis monooxygenase family protein [Burkholderia lata]|uniref:antibiotic biosynthesis monooxygenase family protein n=1 Tax=Burkholderia lata (strain ATCC 17760 / DSM 23089 / LMG 22485 / NCIMB 9086 / R18194 / 383) TaxID=482957 RepID=UPI001582A73B|nr:antibiotic biosynthesis monooxygenase [Burkholderia lata]